MNRYSVRWTDNALLDLESIITEIEGYSLSYADRWLEKVLSREEQLSTFPETGANEMLLKPGYKFITEGHYKIVFRIEAHIVWVVKVFDTRQDPDKLKKS